MVTAPEASLFMITLYSLLQVLMELLFVGAHAFSATGLLPLKNAYVLELLAILSFRFVYAYLFRWNTLHWASSWIVANCTFILSAYVASV